ncbi:hypothetical protein ACT40K_12135 [Acinetobacter baumannii]
MKKLDFQISKITEVKNPIYYGDDFLHLYIHTEQASYIQFFCLDLFYYEDNINELLACILNKGTRADYSFREWIVNTEFKRNILIEELAIQANGLINQLDIILNESAASLSAKVPERILMYF